MLNELNKLPSQTMTEESDTPEDILSSSLSTLYDYAPISHTTTRFTHIHNNPTKTTVVLRTPDTLAANWALHASAIWVSALFLADHIEELGLGTATTTIRVLELGAGAGLPSILVSKLYPSHVRVTASDYPDSALLQTLTDNISANDVPESTCRAVGYAWGDDIGILGHAHFDMIVAADTLWNPSLHACFLDTLRAALTRSADARIHLVAGLHTGRWTLHSFLNAAGNIFDITSAVERRVSDSNERPWDMSRAESVDEDEGERRKWVVWITMRWKVGDLGKEW